MLDLLQLRTFENYVVRHLLEELRFRFHVAGNHEFKAITIRLFRHEVLPLAEPASSNERADFLRDDVLQFVRADSVEQPIDQLLLLRINRLTRRPAFDLLVGQESSLHSVNDIIERIRSIVRPVHNLAFDALERVELLAGLKVQRNFGFAKYKAALRALRVVQ